MATGNTESSVPVTVERAGHFIDALHTACRAWGFERATDGDRCRSQESSGTADALSAQLKTIAFRGHGRFFGHM